MKRRLHPGWLIAAAGGLLLALPLAWAWRALIRELVVIPIAYFLWQIGRFLDSLPQPLLWGVLVLGASLVALRSLTGGVLAALPPSRSTADFGGRVSDWLRWLHLTQRGIYSKDGLARHVGDAAIAVLAHRQQRSPRETRLQLREGQLELPPILNAYLRSALGQASLEHPPTLATLLPFRLHHAHPEVAAELEAIIHFLETTLDADATVETAPEDR